VRLNKNRRLTGGGAVAREKIGTSGGASVENANAPAAHCGKTQSRTTAHLREKRKPRTKNQEMAAHDSGPGNPSACFVEGEYGPGRTDGRRQNKTRGWILRCREEKIPHGLESTPKITPKMKISDPKREHQEHPKLRFFQWKSNMVLTPRRSPPSLPLVNWN
jgi:hypothetical protein